MKKPNIVFILTDDQGYGDLGCTGNSIINTPNINTLYSESVSFSDFHVGPTCAPTRAGLLTGHYHNSTGVWHTIGGRSLLRKDEVSLADIFKNNGYTTGIFGKWHLGDNYPYRPQDRGFNEVIMHGGGGIGQTPDYWGNDYFDDTYSNMGEHEAFEGYCTDVFFRKGMEFIKRHKDEPFFCYIPTNAPHLPYNVEEKYADLYRGSVPEDRAKFYGMITNIDENIGKLREMLIEEGLAENTIVIFMTDNGTSGGCKVGKDGHVTEGYNALMRGVKGSPYDGGHRVAFTLHWPSGGYDNFIDAKGLSANVDFLPTLIDLCGLTSPENLNFDGVSLVPMMKEEIIESGRYVVTDSQRVPFPIKWKESCVMQNKWRLVNGKELYDVSNDPGQVEDLAGLIPDKVKELRRAYEIWWNKVSERFDEEIPISIGSDKEKLTVINSMDWRGDMADCAWNQGQIRAGKICNSYVEILVEQDGKYCFELYRWPIEADMKIRDGIEGELVGWFSGGVALPIMKASIKIQDKKFTKHVEADDKKIDFEIELKKGNTHLTTYFEDEEGFVRGAYYVNCYKCV